MDPLVRGGEPSLSRIDLIRDRDRDRVRVRARVLDLKCECYSALMAAFPPELIRGDLAPGDAKAVDFDWTGINLVRIRRADHPLFGAAYQRLWDEFGPRGEMEKRAVIEERLAWDPSRPFNDHSLLYEMVVVESRGQILALRGHPAIVPPASRRDAPANTIVHLSPLLLEPRMRGSGLSGWMRAFPIQTARECAARAGRAAAGAAPR